ncbi:checkpoint protein HUS1-like [Ruditapes philippinarum]|uniref:checkpoint protein HUS1-like n=1 Tax=Ruditapes philippinarum TaxID=129788 RepID=UPI00295BA187|nr:checkpoint protein HUS1-like [Ruditapes philippinarum]
MRFRGKLVDIGCIQHFTRVVTTVSKLIKTCVLRVTTSALYFILSEKVVNGGIQIWCELPQGHFFDEYAMEGVSAEANEIYLEMSPENLVKALKTAQMAKWVKVKLTKKHAPCLTVEVDLPTLGSHSRVVVHDIPVTVVPRRLWQEYQEPEVPQFDVSIIMPQMKVLRNIVDKMKNLSNNLLLSANRQGELKVSVETDMVSVSTHFQDLINPTSRDDAGRPAQLSPNYDPEEFAEARIDIRKFAQFLSGQQVSPSRVICNIADNSVVHFYLMNDDVSLQYFMPVMVL